MKSTFSICFYVKKDKQKANGTYPLFVRITVDGMPKQEKQPDALRKPDVLIEC